MQAQSRGIATASLEGPCQPSAGPERVDQRRGEVRCCPKHRVHCTCHFRSENVRNRAQECRKRIPREKLYLIASRSSQLGTIEPISWPFLFLDRFGDIFASIFQCGLFLSSTGFRKVYLIRLRVYSGNWAIGGGSSRGGSSREGFSRRVPSRRVPCLRQEGIVPMLKASL